MMTKIAAVLLLCISFGASSVTCSRQVGAAHTSHVCFAFPQTRTHFSRLRLRTKESYQPEVSGTAGERAILVLGDEEEESLRYKYSSHIRTLRSCNLAGVVNADDSSKERMITVELGKGPNLVGVTGETGSGKSLLVARVAELITGGKASATLVPPLEGQENDTDHSQVFVEMIIQLGEPHLTAVQQCLVTLGLDSAIQLRPDEAGKHAELSLQRCLQQTSTKRLKSQCRVNGHPITLKALRTIASPLVAVVDATAAASALSRPPSRLAIVDTGVAMAVRSFAQSAKTKYRSCREHRERLELELASRVLPPAMTDSNDGEKDLELLQHWVDELDAFEGRIDRFCASVASQQLSPGSAISRSASSLCLQPWSEDYSSDINLAGTTSCLYSRLVDFRETVRALDAQLLAARNAYDTLSSLSVPDSAITAIERARNFLFEASDHEGDGSPLTAGAEESHDHLNRIEESIMACAQSMEDDQKGLLRILEVARGGLFVSIDDIDVIVADWNALSRKHGVVPYVLPSCHRSLRGELDGNVEALQKLPQAMVDEKEALEEFEKASTMLSNARQSVATRLSSAVTRRLPSLGMERSTFEAALRTNVRRCSDLSAYGVGTALGVDAVDFMLLHAQEEDSKKNALSGGRVDLVASSGEKARILLAIECELPGSIGASRGIIQDDVGDDLDAKMSMSSVPPVAVIYDEIDAHVGGRAGVAMASMLADQTRSRSGGGARTQVISITHSPSVAAIADKHLVIEKSERHGDLASGSVPVRALMVEKQARRKELARMASGNLASEEAEVFAAALLRDGASRQEEANQ